TVDPGFAGQPFIPEMLDKIKEIKTFREQHHLHYEIEVDGSCNANTYKPLIDAGADILIVGTSGLFNHAEDISEAWDIMVKEIAKYERE
ncbi:MAG TPA: allulose-6-phosphate 3-epimerase, partial [Pasteurellaceae bacterium]|nr:allulose-6-phosphate 3-epimerase [Pasteurellaceae bacterium]